MHVIIYLQFQQLVYVNNMLQSNSLITSGLEGG